MRYVWILAAAAGLILALALASRRHPPSEFAHELSSGNHPLAPEFSVPTIDGNTLDLASYRGKVVLLDFWATWCDPCREEIPRFVQFQEKFGGLGFQVIGISMDDGPEPVRRFYREFHMNYPVAMGGARLGELYGGVLGLPIAFLIGRDGRIYSKHIGATDPLVLEREIADLLLPRKQSKFKMLAPWGDFEKVTRELRAEQVKLKMRVTTSSVTVQHVLCKSIHLGTMDRADIPLYRDL